MNSTRKRRRVWVALPLAALMLASGCMHAEHRPAAATEAEMLPASGRQPGAGAGAAATEPAVDPAAIAALERMGAFLREQPAFAIKADTTTDELLENGQKIQLAEVVEMWVKRPNRLRVNRESDGRRRQSFYDGKTFTLYGPRLGYYATFDAPPTLHELIDVVQQRYNMELPLADLFYWGTNQSGIRDIESAMLIGPSKVGDVDSDHYALQQNDVDWQIWIQRGAQPLPRKLVITSKHELGQPQYTAVLGWDLQPTADDRAFTFEPPKGARRIVFEQAGNMLRPDD